MIIRFFRTKLLASLGDLSNKNLEHTNNVTQGAKNNNNHITRYIRQNLSSDQSTKKEQFFKNNHIY